MREPILVMKQGAMSQEAEEKLKAMRMCGVHLGKFIEYTILNFDVESYLRGRIEDAKCEWILNPEKLEEETNE